MRFPFHALTDKIDFPNPENATQEGLVAVGGDLRIERLLKAYSEGIFPWYSEGQPILWFSPDPRMVLYPDRFKRSSSLQRLIKSNRYTLRIDTNFESVIKACASVPRPGQDGTWITPEMIDAYIELHRLGYAHSFETYRDGSLIGGLYGLSLGAAFFGESMFHQAPDASKFAFHHLVALSIKWNFNFIDAQTPTPHLASLGAENISRSQFLKELETALSAESRIGHWTPSH